MTHKATFAPAAIREIDEIIDYIARDKPEAAEQWLVRIEQTCELLARNPGLGELRPGLGHPNLRSFSAGNYVIYFLPIDDGVEIARIVHGSQDTRRL